MDTGCFADIRVITAENHDGNWKQKEKYMDNLASLRLDNVFNYS